MKNVASERVLPEKNVARGVVVIEVTIVCGCCEESTIGGEGHSRASLTVSVF
jgi:hypothetical protein